jgi:hypothetical protein
MNSTPWARIRHVDDSTSVVTDFDLVNVDPFGLAELSSQGPFAVTGHGFRVEDNLAIENVRRRSTMKAAVRFNAPPRLFVLVKNGWLPTALTSPRTLLLDRNILRRLRMFASNRGDPGDNFWVGFLTTGTMAFNPALCAHEGREGHPPTMEQFRSEYQSAAEVIRSSLPRAQLIELTEENLEQLYSNVVAIRETHTAEAHFLRRVAPLLTERLPEAQLLAAEDQLFEIAAGTRLPSSSLTLILAISCLYEDRAGSPPLAARGILKPTAAYTVADAHNAISDLRAIQFLIMGLSMFGEEIALCTSDRSLAAFWCSLAPTPGSWQNHQFTFTAQVSTTLLPAAVYEDRVRIGERIAGLLQG